MLTTRFVVYWWDEQDREQSETFSGRGAYLKAIGLRDRLANRGAHIVRQELRPVMTWVSVERVDDAHPRQKLV